MGGILAVMVQGLTAQLMLNECDVADKTVVITSAAGGVGNMLVQLIKLQGAAKVIGIAGSNEKLETVRSLPLHAIRSDH
ncbi:TPA: hypothetical protein OUE92_001723 [Serratia marcescens]|nr:hypothetical protein [Serratia marcescens]